MSFTKKIDQKIRHWNHRRIYTMRAFRMGLFKMFFDQSIHGTYTPPPQTIDILRLDGKIGDSVVGTGFLLKIHNCFPDCKIRVFTNPQCEFLYFGLSNVEVVIVRKGFLNSVGIFLKLDRKSADVVINSTHILSPSSLFLSRFIKASKKIVFFNLDWKMYSDHVQYDSFKDHITGRYTSILKCLGAKSNNAFPEHDQFRYLIVPHKPDIEKAEFKLGPYKNLNRKLVVLNSFAGARLRNFNQTTTVHLVRELTEKLNATVISIGNKGDLNIIRAWQKENPLPNWVSFDEGDFGFNMAVMDQAEVVITPDTSIVHVACALKKKLVAVYREDTGDENNSVIWAPLGTEFRMVYAPKPENRNTELDVNSVSVSEIVAKTAQLLEKK